MDEEGEVGNNSKRKRVGRGREEGTSGRVDRGGW